MKVYLDITNEVIQKVEDTKRVFTGDMTSKLEVVPKAGQTFANKFILLSAKLPNGRNVGPKEADNGATTSLYTFTLSKENGFALVKGLTNFYIWVGDTTTNMQKCYGAVVTNINEAVSVGDSSYFIQVDDSTAEEILHDLQADMSSLSSTVASVTGRVATAERDISDLDANMTEVFRVQANHSTRINALENVTQTNTEKSLNYYTKPETENYVQNKFNQYIFNVDIRDEEIYDHDDFSRLFMGINDKDSKELDSFKVRIIFGAQYLTDVFHSILPLVSIDQVGTTVTYTFQNDDYYVIVTQSGFSDETFTITWGETTAPYYSKSATDGLLAAKEDKANKVTSISSSSTNQQYPSAKAVYDLIEALPEPMLFKGTLGTNGTITTLPAASSSNEGFTYKVIENGTYASQQAAVGDVFVSNGSEWVLIPSGDESVVSDTWRTIQVNGTDLLGNGIGTGKANFKSGSGIQVTGSGNDITIALAELLYSATKTYAANQVALYNGYFFLSLVDNNTGNTPDSTQDTAYWARVFV